MDMKNYIEMGEKKAGTLIKLAEILEIKPNYLSMIKSNQRGLPDSACIQLADYIKVEKIEVIAASNLVTEKDEKKREIFKSCFKKTSIAAGLALAIGATSIMSPPPANAAIQSSSERSVYIM